MGVFHREGGKALGLGGGAVGLGVVPQVGGGNRAQPLPGQAVQAPLPLGDPLLPGDKAEVKGAEPCLLHQPLDCGLLQVHVGEQPQGLPLAAQFLHHRQEVGIPLAAPGFQVPLPGHALPGIYSGLLLQHRPDLPQCHLPGEAGPGLSLSGLLLRLAAHPGKARDAQGLLQQQEQVLGPGQGTEEQGVEHVEGHRGKGRQPPEQCLPALPAGQGGLRPTLPQQGDVPVLSPQQGPAPQSQKHPRPLEPAAPSPPEGQVLFPHLWVFAQSQLAQPAGQVKAPHWSRPPS